MRRRRFVGLLCGTATLWPLRSLAQQKTWRIGFLAARSRSTAANPDVYYDAFVDALRRLGYVEGKNLVIEWRYADGDYARLPALAAELVKLKVDVIATHVTAAVKAAHGATRTIPIVSSSMADPVASGFAASLARPGGNVTGLANIAVDATSKRLELLAAMRPGLSRVAVLLNPDSPATPAFLKSAQGLAKAGGIRIVPVYARSAAEFERGFAEMAKERSDAVMVTNDAVFLGEARRIADLASHHRLPSMSPYAEVALAGGLMSYGQDFSENYRRAAAYVDKILKGAKPGELPIEQPTTFQLVINRKAAKGLGLNVPGDLLVRADRVID